MDDGCISASSKTPHPRALIEIGIEMKNTSCLETESDYRVLLAPCFVYCSLMTGIKLVLFPQVTWLVALFPLALACIGCCFLLAAKVFNSL